MILEPCDKIEFSTGSERLHDPSGDPRLQQPTKTNGDGDADAAVGEPSVHGGAHLFCSSCHYLILW